MKRYISAAVGCILLVLVTGTSQGALTHYWPFDTDYSDSVGSANGTVVGGGVSVTPDAGNYVRGSGALEIDSNGGAMGYIDVVQPCILNGQKQVSVSAWYRYEDIGSDGSDSRRYVWSTVPDYSCEFSIGSADDGEWFFRTVSLSSHYDNSGPVVTDGLWHHVVTIWDRNADRAYYYHDGVLRDSPSTSASSDDLSVSTGFHIGDYRDGNGGRNFDGYIDDLAIYDHALTAVEVRSLYRGASPQALDNLKPVRDALKMNLLAYYGFDETGDAGLANKAPGATGGNASWTAPPINGSTGFDGNAAFNPGDGLSDRGTLLVGNALNLADNDGGNTVRVAVPYGTPELGSVFTISAWTYLAPGAANGSSRFQAFEAKDVGVWDVSWGTAGNYSTTGRNDYYAYVENTSLPILNAFAEEEWDHVALVYDTSGANPTVSVYVNGDPTPATQTDPSGTFVFSAINFGGSRDGASGDRDWDGMIDEVALWTRALPYSEIAALYTFGRSGYSVYQNQGTLFIVR